MKVPAATASVDGHRDAESLFRSKPISEIRNVEATTNKQIQDKKEELRQLVGNRYRDLIDSADSIVLMKSSCESITSNIVSIYSNIRSLSTSPLSETPKFTNPNPSRFKIYGIACRVKYLIDTPENIWGCLDESMFLEAAGRYVRARHAHDMLISNKDHTNVLEKFPLLQHQWQIVESFKVQISQRSRERLLDRGLGIAAYADALAAVAVIDELDPKHVLSLFLETRKSWILQILANRDQKVSGESAVSLLCDVLKIVQVCIGQVGELFLQVLNDMPPFYKVILSSPPASQLFGGIPNPDEEVKLWKLFREKLESVMVTLDKQYISASCLSWLRDCGTQVVSDLNGRSLVVSITTGQDLALAEKLLRETIDNKQVLEGSLEWLKSVFGSEVELPWSRIQELVLEDNFDLWDDVLEDAFTCRMTMIINEKFDDLVQGINLQDFISAIKEVPGENMDFQSYLNRPSTGGGVWFIESNTKRSSQLSINKSSIEENDFRSCLSAYFGPEVSGIRDAVDRCCQTIIEDILSFLDSPKAAARLKDLVPLVQDKCYNSVLALLTELRKELDNLYNKINNGSNSLASAILIERSLFLGKLMFALQNHSKHIPVILGSPKFWSKDTSAAAFDKLPSMFRPSVSSTDSAVSESPGRLTPSTGSRRQSSSAVSALFGTNETASPKLQELINIMKELCIRAHGLWISWLSDELSAILARDLRSDEGLVATTPLRGWDEIMVKQGQSEENAADIKISLPSMPSLYIISFLFRGCEEIHRIGGHVLDKLILEKFASRLLDKVVEIYGDFLSTSESHGSKISEKGVLQILFDIKFTGDVLSGGDFNVKCLSKTPKTKSPFRRKQDQRQAKSASRERTEQLINYFSQKLDPIDWLTYEPYLWENEKQSYLRHAVLFGFFVQLNRMFMDMVQKLSANSESNIMRCSTVPRFKYLPYSAPALSSRATKKSIPSATDESSSRSPWKAYSNVELSQKMSFDDQTNFGVATPFLKSVMQVGSKFGENTFKLGSILSEGQVGIFKDRSAAAMSTFGDILPAQAAGLLSSFSASRSEN